MLKKIGSTFLRLFNKGGPFGPSFHTVFPFIMTMIQSSILTSSFKKKLEILKIRRSEVLIRLRKIAAMNSIIFFGQELKSSYSTKSFF